MKKTLTYERFYCDRCPNQTEEFHGENPEGWKDFYNYKLSTKYDFCPDCTNSFYHWLLGVPKSEDPFPDKLEILHRALDKFAASGGQQTPFDKGWQAALLAIRGAIDYTPGDEKNEKQS